MTRDRIVVDLWARWAGPAPTAPPEVAVHERDGSVSWNVEKWDIDPLDWRERQKQIDGSLSVAAEHVKVITAVAGGLGVGVIFQLYLELYPGEGTASVVLKPELLLPLVQQGTVLMLNAF